MNSNPLTIVGTLNTDLRGGERLEYILDTLSPSKIILEYRNESKELQKRDLQTRTDTLMILLNLFNFDLSSKFKTIIDSYVDSLSENSSFDLFVSEKYIQKNSSSKLEFFDTTAQSDSNFDGSENFSSNRELNLLLNFIRMDPRLIKKSLDLIEEKGAEVLDDFLDFAVTNAYKKFSSMVDFQKKHNDIEYKTLVSESISEDIKIRYKGVHSVFDNFAKHIKESYASNPNLVVISSLNTAAAMKARLGDLDSRVIPLLDYKQID